MHAAAAPALDPRRNPDSIYYEPPGYVKAVPPPPSPTLISFQIKATGEPFRGVEEAAYRVGFRPGTEDGATPSNGMVSEDTGRTIASLHYVQWDLLHNQLRTVAVSIDPETCDIDWGVGWRLLEKLTKLAEILGGELCDGVGHPLSSSARKAIASHIDRVIEKRSSAEVKARSEKLPDGTIKVRGPVSFQHTVKRKVPGRPRLRENVEMLFDVPELGNAEARAHAHRMMLELKQTFAAHRVRRPNMVSMLSAIFASGPPQPDYAKPSRANVANAFLDVLEGVIARGLAVTSTDYLVSDALRWESLAGKQAAQADERAKKGGAA